MESKENEKGSAETHEAPNIHEIPQHIRKFINYKLDFYRLSGIEFISEIGAKATSWIILSTIGVFILVFFSIGMGLLLNNLTGSTYAGFFMVTGFYLLLFLILYFIKGNSIEKPVTNIIIRKLANWKIEDDDEDEN